MEAEEERETPVAVDATGMVDRASREIAAAGCEDPLGDAAAVVAKVLGLSSQALREDGATELTAEQRQEVEALVRRRAEHEPLAYVLGEWPFHGLSFLVDRRVLVPRRETEVLVDVALDLPEEARVHEVGTGSGAIALALLRKRPDLRVTASDLSPEAVEVARANAERLGIALEVTVAEGLPEFVLEEDIDLLIANLPYVTDETIFERSLEVQREPRLAVTGNSGKDGLGVIRGLVEKTPSGWRLALEHDTHHGPAMREMLRDATTMRDYMGEERVTVGFAP